MLVTWALVLSVLTFFISDYLMPLSSRTYQDLLGDVMRELPTFEIEPDSTNSVGDVVMYNGAVEGDRIDDIVMFTLGGDMGMTVSAPSGRLELVDSASFIYQLTLDDSQVLVTSSDVSDYLAAQAEYLRTKAEYDPVRVADERGTLVKAPAAGYVRQLSVAPGDYVAMGQPLATIARSGRMQLRAWVSQRYFDRIGSFTDAAFRLASDDTFRRISDLGGELYTSGRIISQGTTLVPVVFEFNDDRRCPDGAAAEVILLGSERPDVVTVPLSAVTEQQGIYHVYEQLDPNHYRRRQVWLGGNDGERVEVLRGLEGGERIVTRGAVQVRMAAASGSIPHGHTH